MDWLWVGLGVFLTGFWVGTLVGWSARRDKAREDAEERMARILDQPARTGEPHNYSAPASRVTKARIKNRRNWRLHD